MDSWGVRLTWFDCNIYSYFDKGCPKKCMRQSRKVLWVDLSARSSKKFERMAPEATDICLRMLIKRKATKVGLTATVVRNSVLIISHNYYLSDCCMHIFGDNLSWKNCIHHYLQVFCNLVEHKESADEKISRFYIHASFISIHFSPISTQNSYSFNKDFVYKT